MLSATDAVALVERADAEIGCACLLCRTGGEPVKFVWLAKGKGWALAKIARELKRHFGVTLSSSAVRLFVVNHEAPSDG